MRTLFPRTFSMVVFFLLATISCRKDYTTDFKNSFPENDIRTASERDGEGMTVLGQARSIPYAVETIRQAYNNLYHPGLATLLPNYLYVRFLPQNPEDAGELLDSGLELWDFPLHYDIEQMGEYYHDSSVADSTYTWQYAVVPYNYVFPNVPYEVIEELALVPEDSRIAEEAFHLTDNEFETPDTYDPNPPLVNGRFEFTPDHGNSGDSSTGPSGPCGCPTPNHIRKPSGCVTVFDNMLNIWEGVREVKVIVSKSRVLGLVFHRTDYTDAQGCWMIDHKYHGKIHVWVKFESATCNIKTMKGGLDLWGYTFPRRAYVGKFNGPNFNNLSIAFDWTSSIDSKTFRNWVASTANNSVYEFQAYLNVQKINVMPPGNLKILITPWGSVNSGATPMLDKFSVLPQIMLYSSATGILGVLGVLGPAGVALNIAFSSWLVAAAPDVVLNTNESNEVNADDIREILYHELAHTIHFEQVGEAYWLAQIDFVLTNSILDNNPPYGNGNQAGSGRCEIIEMWGFQNGMWATHLRYGVDHSNGLPIASNTWQAILERERFWDDGFIAFGWQYDIQDENALNPIGVIESPGLIDNIHGYDQQKIFSTMTPDMLSGQQQRLLLQQLPPASGLNITEFENLANVYGL